MFAFFPLFPASASTAATMACEEKPELHHCRSRAALHPSSSICTQRSNKPHSGSLVARLQWARGWGGGLGWCHKVKVT